MKKTTTHFHFLLLAVGLAAVSNLAVDAATDREKTLRFPEKLVKSNAYNATPDSDYRHASPAAYDAFHAIKFGVRIHWGLYSMLPEARESWTFLNLSDAERQQYRDSYRQWNPQGFNAEEWMKFFDRAGFRALAITTKHHEGFSLWDTKTRIARRPTYSDPSGPRIESCDVAYSVMETPFKRDIIKEITDAARRHDLKINLYFSHSDWYDADFRPYGHHPFQPPESPGLKWFADRKYRPPVLVPEPTASERAHMMARHRTQLTELLSNYGKIDMVCLDISLGEEVWPELRTTIKQLRQLQPDVMFRNRGVGNYGDYYTPEGFVPGDTSGNSMPWMVIYPLGRHFSWEGDPAKHKGAKWVVTNLIDSVAKGGSFMVGIGPDASGRFHPTAIAQLEEVGAWLKENGEGIFNTHSREGAAWKDGDDIRLTASDDGRALFAHLLVRPTGPVVLHSVKPPAGAQVTLLGHPQPLAWRPSGAGIAVEFPAAAAASPAYTLRISTN